MDLRNLSETELRELNALVYATAWRLTKSKDRATELQQQTFECLMKTRRWNPAKEPSLERHVLGIVVSLRSHGYASKRTRTKYEKRAGIEHVTLYVEDTPSAEDSAVEARELAERRALEAERMAELRRRMAGWPLELAILDHDPLVLKPAELVVIMKRSLAEVNAALARIRRHVRSIAAAAQIDDEEVAS